jgi:hypothetical protein
MNDPFVCTTLITKDIFGKVMPTRFCFRPTYTSGCMVDALTPLVGEEVGPAEGAVVFPAL